jgi:uncharacterized protein
VPQALSFEAPLVPPIYGGIDGGMRPAARAQVRAALVRGLDPVWVVAHVARALDAVLELYQTSVPAELPRPACESGCSFCCRQRVELTAPEVFFLARCLRDRLTEPERQKVKDTTERLRPMSGREHHLAQIPCALLDEDGRCRAYESRPLACRRAHSATRSVCLQVHEHPESSQRIPDVPELSFHLSALVVGYLEGMALAARPPEQYELHAAVALALEEPDPERRWASGEDLLRAARTRSADEVADVLLSSA